MRPEHDRRLNRTAKEDYKIEMVIVFLLGIVLGFVISNTDIMIKDRVKICEQLLIKEKNEKISESN